MREKVGMWLKVDMRMMVGYEERERVEMGIKMRVGIRVEMRMRV